MIDKSKVRFFGNDQLLAYETKCYKYTLRPWVNYKNELKIDITITYLNSLTKKTFDLFHLKIPKKHINILKELIEYYESTVIIFKVMDKGCTYVNVYEDVFNQQIGGKNEK